MTIFILVLYISGQLLTVALSRHVVCARMLCECVRVCVCVCVREGVRRVRRILKGFVCIILVLMSVAGWCMC